MYMNKADQNNHVSEQQDHIVFIKSSDVYEVGNLRHKF